MQSLARPTDTGTTSQPPSGGRFVGAGQLVMPWATAQLALDGRAYAPATNEPAGGPEGADRTPILGPLHGVCHQTPAERRWERQKTMWDVLGPLRDAAGNLLYETGERCAKCRKVRCPRPDAPTPELRRTEFGSWDVTGTVLCGNAHVCPMCSFKRARTVVGELSACMERHLQSPTALAPDVWMLTLTQPHERGDGFRTTVDRLTASWRALTRSREWRQFKRRWGVVGVVRCWDDTIGSNGLHGHWHVGLFVEHALWAGARFAQLDEATRRVAFETVAEELRNVWVRVSAGAGCNLVGGAKRDAFREIGLHLQGGAEGAQYFCKWGLSEELAFEPAKGGRSHWVLLDEARKGDKRAAVEFVEYYEATKGLAVVTGVAQLRKQLGVTDDVLDAHLDELARRRELQAIADGQELERVEPLQVTIAPWYWSAAIGAGWHEVCRIADEASSAGADVQHAVDGFLEARALGP